MSVCCIGEPEQVVPEYNATWYLTPPAHPLSVAAFQLRVGVLSFVQVPFEGDNPVGLVGPCLSIFIWLDVFVDSELPTLSVE